ncbi:hypothetical protein [Gimesia aquarii]|uniref:Tripartite ATP-independent periplasmic transporter, DctQ component n=1 Tax=Gimesia aquarii TaxID=2527964 RepID=A0A517WP49_9PLAN|nr:hypothetical protein [Gimesia aquarii]QDU07027.1 hypothetical protein V202x_03720 [Gimesia aquarii]
MASTETMLTNEESKHPLYALVNTRTEAIIVFVFLILFSLLSLATFVILFRSEVGPGLGLIHSSVEMRIFFMPLLRALGAIFLALDLRQYLLSLGAIQRNESDAQEKLIKALRSGWTTLSVIALLAMAYAAWSFLPAP